MALLVLIIGAVILVAAVRGTHGELAAAIRQDVPAFAIWGAAIFGVAMIGFIPGLKPVSRGLLALLVLAIILANYKRILAAFQGVAYGSQAQAQAAVATGGAAVATGDNRTLLASLSSIVGAIQDGGNGDYSDFFGAPQASAGTPLASALAAATAAEDAPMQRTPRAPLSVGETVVGGSDPISAAVGAVVRGVNSFFAPVATGNAAWDDAMNAAHVAQFTYSQEYEADIRNRLASGQLAKGTPEYESQLAYMANLRGGVATADAELARLKAAGF